MKQNTQSGQTLILLLFFVMVGIMITSTFVSIISNNSSAASDLQQGEIARQMAEGGAENALLQILKNNYTPGGVTTENITFTDGTVSVTITSSGSN